MQRGVQFLRRAERSESVSDRARYGREPSAGCGPRGAVCSCLRYRRGRCRSDACSARQTGRSSYRQGKTGSGRCAERFSRRACAHSPTYPLSGKCGHGGYQAHRRGLDRSGRSRCKTRNARRRAGFRWRVWWRLGQLLWRKSGLHQDMIPVLRMLRGSNFARRPAVIAAMGAGSGWNVGPQPLPRISVAWPAVPPMAVRRS